MREILFRGKTLDDKTWIYGNYYKGIDDDYIQNSEYDTFDKVNKNTVGQFTGVEDDKRVKIFEGDIVSFYEVLGQQGIMKPFKGVVKYGNGYYYVEYINERNRKGMWNLSSCWHLVVVGNIHDNKEFYNELQNHVKQQDRHHDIRNERTSRTSG